MRKNLAFLWGRRASAMERYELADDGGLELFFALPFRIAHREQLLPRCIDGLVSIALACLGAITVLVRLDFVPAFELLVRLESLDRTKTVRLIERHGGGVLFVDRELADAELGDAVLQKGTADTASAGVLLFAGIERYPMPTYMRWRQRKGVRDCRKIGTNGRLRSGCRRLGRHRPIQTRSWPQRFMLRSMLEMPH